jgi:hypothetical protein
MYQLTEHVDKPAALASLKDGEQVTLSDDGTVTDATWQGTYIFHPAGSVVPVTNMYVRWKDDLVTLTPTPATITQTAPGTLDASWVMQTTFSNTVTGRQQTIATLEFDPGNSVWFIPNYAWLFRVNGNGQYVTLVDAFELVSGGQPVYAQDAAGQVMGGECNANGCRATVPQNQAFKLVQVGAQPVPKSSGFWRP